MSYDHLWLCPTLDPATWVDRLDISTYVRFNPATWVDCEFEFEVSVSAGEAYCIDELYSFCTLEDAKAFYEQGVEDREFVTQDGFACGFDRVSLRVRGTEIAARSKPGRKVSDVNEADMTTKAPTEQVDQSEVSKKEP